MSVVSSVVKYQYVFQLSPANIPTYNSLTYPSLEKRWRTRPPKGELIGVSASVNEEMVGLVVAELSFEEDAEIVSLFVLPPHRHKGIGTKLLYHLERKVLTHQTTQFQINYQRTSLTDLALEPILRRLKWQYPDTTYLVAKSCTELLSQAPWLNHHPLPKNFEIFPWVELTRADQNTLQQLDYPKSLSPFSQDLRLEPLNSIGLRDNGEIIGWMLTHRVAPDTIRYSTLYVCEKYQALGRGITLIALAIKRQIASPIPYCKCAVAAENTQMQRFVERRLKPYLSLQGEARQAKKYIR